MNEKQIVKNYLFSSPFIEERLYFKAINDHVKLHQKVLVPFYRGAVVFKSVFERNLFHQIVLVPFYRGAVVFREL